ncbi:MAG: tetratricopeptide repeat protein [Acidobacteriota bacterium]
MIDERERSPREYVFHHGIIRDVVYGSALVARRRRLHGAVADAIEGRRRPDRFAAPGVLGHHREHAGQPLAARRQYLEAARQAQRVHANEESEAFYRRHIALARRVDRHLIAARIELGAVVLVLVGRNAEAYELVAAAVSEASSLRDRRTKLESQSAMGYVLRAMGRLAEAEEVVRGGIALSLRGKRTNGPDKLLPLLGVVLTEQGRVAEAISAYRQALRSGPTARGRVTIFVNLGNLHRRRGETTEAERWYRRAVLAARRADAHQQEGHALGNLSHLLAITGKRRESDRMLRKALAIAERIGDMRAISTWRGNLAAAAVKEGRLEEAARDVEKSLEIARFMNDPRSELIWMGNLAGIHALDGRLEEALALYRSVLGMRHAVADPVVVADALRDTASVLSFMGGNDGEARQLLDDGARLLASANHPRQLLKLWCVRGHLSLCAGQSAAGEIARAKEVSAGAFDRNDALQRLARAQEAFRRGQPLLRGIDPGDLTAGQKRWLLSARPEVVPASLRATLAAGGVRRNPRSRRSTSPTVVDREADSEALRGTRSARAVVIMGPP